MENVYVMSVLADFLHSVTVEHVLKAVVAAIAVYCLVKFLGLRKKKNYPPGPRGLPIVGYLPFLTETPHLKFEQLRKKYGNIFSLYLGRQYTVVLSDVDSLREAYSKDEFLGRPPENIFCPVPFKANLSTVNGKEWMEQRKLIFHALKGVGKGNEFVENIIQEEIHRFFDYIGEMNGKPFDLKEILCTSVSNILTSLAFGERYDHADEERVFMTNVVQEFIEHASQVGSQQYLSWLQWMPIVNKYQGWDKYRKTLARLRKFFEKAIDEHQKTLDPNAPRDYVDAFLILEKKAKDEGQPSSFSYEMLVGTLFTLLVAGSETVRTSLHWVFYVLLAYPEVQKKIQAEVDEVIGRERHTAWSYQKDMPYTMSVLMEVQRVFTLVPINAFHYTLEDSKVGGYDIPKGTVVLNNLWAVLHDPGNWERPEKFVPERFLDKSERNVVKPKSYLPFSFGKRMCPGEALSMVEMFLFLTATLQRYDVSLPRGATINLEANYLVTTQPKVQKLCITPRQFAQ